MLELMPDTIDGDRKSFQSRKTSNSSSKSVESIEELERLRKSLLLKSSKHLSSFTLNSRDSLRLSDEQVKTIASMLPDEVLKSSFDYEVQTFEAAAFFVDVSGFTDLSDKYQRVDNGASKLSTVLNFYLGSMVQEILAHDGDVIKYAGDAFIAIFRAENNLLLQDAVHKSIDTALIIQKNFSNFLTDVGVTLNVKIAISAGEIFFSLIGDERSSHYVIVGDPIWGVKSLQESIKPGEILVTPKAWFYAQESLYIYQHVRDLRHFNVTGFRDQMEVLQRQQEAVMNFNEMHKKMEEDRDLSGASVTLQSLEPFSMNIQVDEREPVSLRRNINLTLNSKSKKFLRRFIIAPLLTAIDRNEPVEILTEMRNVVIVFANFVVAKTSSIELVGTVDGIYKTLCGIVDSHDGIVNKIMLFDKDTMFLIIFGLRGFKHELEPRIGLRCAAELRENFKNSTNVLSVSIGVTSGMSYCGLVGHSLRREYSVVSVTVNKAARLMMAYPDIVSCDQETLLQSKMDMKHFTSLPKKNLKGLRDEVFVYEFKEITDKMEMKEPLEHEFSILGRTEILIKARKLVMAAIKGHNRVADVIISCLIVKGETQQGKTRVLNEIFAGCLKENLKCLHLTLSVRHSKFPYRVVSKIIQRAMKLPSDASAEEIQKRIEEKFRGIIVDDFLSVLNPIFMTNFEVSEIFHFINDEDVDTIRHKIFKILSRLASDDFLIVLIDDLEYLDEESFNLLSFVFETGSIFIIATLGEQRKLNVERKKILKSSHVAHHRLDEIESSHISTLACRSLNVSTLSPDVEKYLQKNSNGNPGWIETCTKSLVQSQKVEIKSVEGDECCLQLCSRPSSDQQRVAFFKVHPRRDFLASANADRDLMTYDALSSYEQLVCKCAAVIGVEFKRQMLFDIMASSTERMVGKAMLKLFELQIFACASTFASRQATPRRKTSNDIIACNCRDVQVADSCRDLPKFASCARAKFQSSILRSVVYDSLTEKQRLQYHKRSLAYLHRETRRCESCGSGRFLSLMVEDFDFNFINGVVNSDDASFNTMIEYFKSINMPIQRASKKTSILPSIHSKKNFKIRPVVLNFRNYDFHDCKCNSILGAVYEEMIKHCYGGKLTLKMIDTEIELAAVCIKRSDFHRATNLLLKALMALNNNSFTDVSRFDEYLRGRALALQGICFSSVMQHRNALELYMQSCKNFDVEFPRSFNLKARLKLQKLIVNIKTSVDHRELPKVSRMSALVTTQLSSTMSCMFDLFLETKEIDLAKLAAFWSLRKALNTSRSFSNIARSFANVLKILSVTGGADQFMWLQKAALQQLIRTLFVDELDLEGLTNVVRMYQGIMMCQITRNDIRNAVKLGELTTNLCSRIQQKSFLIEIVQQLFLLLIRVERFQAAETLLQRFSAVMESMNDANGLALCDALSRMLE